MKKNTLQKVFATLSATFLLGSFVACDIVNNSGNDSNEGVYTPHSVWTTYNTMKVMQDPTFNGNYYMQDAKISATMAKNEIESAQLFVTTGSDAVSSFELIATDLINENGDVFPVEQIDVYAQKYINVTEKTVGNNLKEYPVGWYPDAIVPMDLYKKFGENSIAANSNQGFTVDFTAPANTPAGTYTGTFTLKLDGKTENIPVSVRVWDFALPTQSASNSCILIYENAILYGEMTTEIDYWYERYYDLLLRYKMNAFTVPNSYNGPEEMVQSVKKYWNHPNFASFGMPHQSWLGSNYMAYWHDVLYLLGENSTEDMILFDKAYFYPIDEPNKEEELVVARDWMARLQALRQQVADELVANGVFEGKSEAFKNRVLESLLNVQIVITAMGFEDGLASTDVTYCPNINEYDPYENWIGISEHAKENNNQMWYYTANVPTTPYATQHIDDYLVTTRIMKWQQKYYDFSAWLNWAACHSYKTTAFTNIVGNINPYEDPMRIFGPGNVSNGDGYVMYPAGRYEADEPIASIRLMAYRDGQDDLDMLNYLDELYAEYESYYGVEQGTFDVNNVLKGLYDRLFCRAITYYADEELAVVRQTVANEIENVLYGENKFVYTVNYTGNYADYNFYVANGYTLKLGGNMLTGVASGSGMKYTYRVNLTQEKVLESVVLEKNGEENTVALYESSDVRAVDILGEDCEFSLSSGSNITKTENSIVFDVKSKILTLDTQTLRFIPLIKMNVKNDFNVVELDLKNLKNENVTMKLVIMSTDGYSCEMDISLNANRAQTVEVLNRLPKEQKVQEIRIEFLNVYSQDGGLKPYADRQIELTGVRFK